MVSPYSFRIGLHRAALALIPVVPLLGWLVYHHHATGRFFGNADFYQALASSSVFSQRLMFCRGMLRNRPPQSGPCEERVFCCPTHPRLLLWEFGVNLSESNPWCVHVVSDSSPKIED